MKLLKPRSLRRDIHVGFQPVTVHADYVVFGVCASEAVGLCVFYITNVMQLITIFFIIISALHVLGGFSAHHQELIKLYVQPWVLSFFPAVRGARWRSG